MRSLLMPWILAIGLISTAPVQAGCPPEGESKASLQALKLLKFASPDAAARQALAEGLVDCLGDPDPQLRDGVAYEALMQWLRAGDIDGDGLRAVRDRLYPLLDGDDTAGFRKPFAALALSEVARTDRIKPWMAVEERAAMVESAAAYLESVRDYRGYDNSEGWRHGVAHGTDWLMQLALNPALDRAHLDRILAAVATQVVPGQAGSQAAHAYVFGEPGRLARPVLQTARRGLHSDAEFETWLTALTPGLGDATLAYSDAGWLARRHDLLAFLTALYLEADQSEDPQIRRLKPAIVAALKTVP